MRKLNEMEQADNLDAALDQFLTSQEKFNTADWAGALSRRLLELDNAFASSSESGAESSRVPITFGIEGSLPRTPMVNWEAPLARRLPLNGWLMAAVLAIAAFGLGLFGANHGWWTDDDNRPPGASIAAVSTSAATAVVSEMVVTPSACTLEPLTRERYDALVGEATPLPLDAFQADLAAKTDALGKKLQLRVVAGEVVITAGSELPPGVARELEATLSSWIACGNAGNELALSGIMSDDYIRMINDPDTWFAEIEVTQEVTPTQLTEMKFEQVRLLADGSVVAVVLDSFSPSDETTSESEEMPTGTVAIQGMIYLFVPTSKGWRLDFAQSGYQFRLASSEVVEGATPDALYVDELVVQALTCTLSPLSNERYDEITAPATPETKPIQNLIPAKSSAVRKSLDLHFDDGGIVLKGGELAPADLVTEIMSLFSSFLRCGNNDNGAAAARFLSDDFIASNTQPDDLFFQIRRPDGTSLFPIDALRLEQFRYLPEWQRIVAVWNWPTGDPAVTESVILVFVQTPDGWKLDVPLRIDPTDLDYFEQLESANGEPANDVKEILVTPSTCTLEPLTQERYAEIVGTATSITEEEYDNSQVAMTNELLPALDLSVVNGTIRITGGSAVPKETADEVASVLASYIACGNSGDLPATFRIFSDDFIARLPDRDQFLADLESPLTPAATPLTELHVTQLRLLPDGRIVLTWAIDLSSSTGIEYSPEPTPQGTVALDGILLVFVKDTDGWKLDFHRGGEIFRLPAGKAVAATEATRATFIEEMMVTPSACTLEPLTQERYAEIMGTATPIVDDAIVDAGIVMSNALKAELDAQVVGGQFVFRGGSAVPSEIADEIRQSAASYLGCWNDGNFLATLEFLTDDLLMATQDLRRWQKSMALVRPGEENTLPEMRLTQLRLLSDGRVAAVWAGPFPDNSFELIPLLGTETPDGTIRTDGPIYVFKLTSQGWRLDWIEAAGLYQLPPPAGPVIGTPLAD